MAVRLLERSGATATPEAIARDTGLNRSAVGRALAWLAAEAPDWNGCAQAQLEFARPPAVLVRRRAVPSGALPPWRLALADAQRSVNGSRSWDLYADLYSPAADALFARGQLDDLVALAVSYVEQATGDELDTRERGRVAQLVRAYGKASLFGLHEALPRAGGGGLDAMTRYANAVCKSTVRKIRQSEETP
jgi:hypothetical protein